MKRGITVCLMLLLFSSCIEFETQVLSYKYNKDKDQLLIVQEYIGIHAEGDKDVIGGKEIEQLKSVIDSERTFFFNNWLAEFSRDKMQESLAKMPDRIDKAENEADKLELLKSKDFLAILLKSIKVENGDFYLNEEEKLCAYQYITLNNVSKFLKASNALISQNIINKSVKENRPKFKTFDLLAAAAKKDHQWISFKGNQLVVRCPVDPKEFVDAKKEFHKKIKGSKDDGKDVIMLKNILSNDVWMNHNDGMMEVTLGQVDDVLSSITMDIFPGYDDSVKTWVKENGLIKEVDIEAKKKAFLK